MYTQYLSTFYQMGEKVNNTLQNNKIDPFYVLFSVALISIIIGSFYICHHETKSIKNRETRKYKTT